MGTGSTSADHLLARGTRLGKYEILAPLGEGGMAEVYVARTTGIEGFEKLVALKRILPHLARDDEFVEMFLDEARLAARLSHPNVAAVYDIGREDGTYFFAMEYLHGKDLRAVLKSAALNKRGMSRAKALTIVARIAAGLHHAHTATTADGKPLGIVHRDVSLANIIVTFDGSVKILDFGVAKAITRRSRTRTGSVKGKVQYMSPEQCRGDALDARSDVFALGIVLFELTTGTRMYGKKDDIAIMHQVVYEGLPTPSSRRDDYPPELEAIVLKALARDPADRYASAQALQQAIEEYASAAQLTLSSIELASYLRDLYGEPTDPRVALLAAAPPAATAEAQPEGLPMPVSAKGEERTTTNLSASIPGLRKTPRAWGAAALLLAVGAATAGAIALSGDASTDPIAAPASSATGQPASAAIEESASANPEPSATASASPEPKSLPSAEPTTPDPTAPDPTTPDPPRPAQQPPPQQPKQPLPPAPQPPPKQPPPPAPRDEDKLLLP